MGFVQPQRQPGVVDQKIDGGEARRQARQAARKRRRGLDIEHAGEQSLGIDLLLQLSQPLQAPAGCDHLRAGIEQAQRQRPADT